MFIWQELQVIDIVFWCYSGLISHLSRIYRREVLIWNSMKWFDYILVLLWLGKTAKSLFIFLFLFLLSWIYYIEGSTGKCHVTSVTVTWQEVTAWHHMMSYDGLYDRHGKVVHRPCSSYISSIENLIGTLSSSLCQTLIKSSWLYSGSGVGSLTKWYLYNMYNMRIRHNRIVI